MRRTESISMCGWCFVAMGVVAAATTPVWCRQGEDQLAVLKAGCRATRDSIHTFSASMVVENADPGKEKSLAFEATCWITPEVSRFRESYPGGRIEECVRTVSERKMLGKHPRPDGKGF